MCKNVKKITFCICDNASKKPRKKHKDHLTWTLFRLNENPVDLSKDYAMMDGMFFSPSTIINKKITNEFILYELNSQNCFDFDFIATEEDVLNIYSNNIMESNYLSFIYKIDKWNINKNINFNNGHRINGKIKIEE